MLAENFGLGTSTFDGTVVNYLAIGNGTEPAAATAGQSYIGSKDSTGLVADGATLALYTEATPEASALPSAATSARPNSTPS